MLDTGFIAAGVLGRRDFTKHPGHPLPNYFAGTNARAFFSAQVGGGTQHISDMEFLIGGTTVYSETFPILGTAPHYIYNPEVLHAEMFDSTHLPSGQNIQVKLRVKADGIWYEDSYAAIAKNAVAVFEHPDTFDFAGEVVDNLFGQSNISVVGVFDQSEWTREDYFTTLTGANHSLVFSHGNNDHIRAGVYAPEDGKPMRVSHFLDTMVNAIGTGSPPYNSTGLPPINMLVFHSCRTGWQTDYVEALYPNANAFAPYYTENQCWWAYKRQLFVSNLSEYAEAVSSLLLEGYSAEYARAVLCDEEYASSHDLRVSECGPSCQTNCEVHDQAGRYVQLDDIVLMGDKKTRVKFVYTGTNFLQGWHRQVAMPGAYE